jgi:hypothetical protein
MFNVTEIKNANRHRQADKQPPIPHEELFDEWPEDNKPMPYFSLVPEQFQRHTGYQNLSPHDQGQFLRLCLDIAKPGKRGRFINMDAVTAKQMKVTIEEWQSLKTYLLEKSLLLESPDRLYLIQPELREQCLRYVRKSKQVVPSSSTA